MTMPRNRAGAMACRSWSRRKKRWRLLEITPRRQRAVSADAAAPCHSDNAKHCCQCCDGGLRPEYFRRRDGRPPCSTPNIICMALWQHTSLCPRHHTRRPDPRAARYQLRQQLFWTGHAVNATIGRAVQSRCSPGAPSGRNGPCDARFTCQICVCFAV